jgi:two-component system, NtrC family, nitrogen regulation response regulator GlnG
MRAEDSATLTLGPFDASTDATDGSSLVPALTIVWHPDVNRVGQVAPLLGLLDKRVSVLRRDEPTFFVPGGHAGEPIHHRGLSREPVLALALLDRGIELRSVDPSAAVEIDGELLRGARLIIQSELARGVILSVSRRFVFCLHAVRFPLTRLPNLGLLGSSDGIDAVRGAIMRAAESPFAVMVRGESGTGKELVARALHGTSARRKGPFIDVNMAVLRAERAAAELFGHERGAFTGATESRPGFFRAAHGGTLFLDEIGFTSADVQPMLLRVLEDRRVQPLGGTHARQVDVRLVTATDAQLEQAVAAGQFQRALYHRLNGGFTISIPPLRARREDIGVLFVHFLKAALAETGESDRLGEPDPRARPWLSARAVAEVARASWPGNVRELRTLAQELAVASAGNTRVETQAIVSAFLYRQAATQASTSPVDDPVPAQAAARPATVSRETLLVALEDAGWNRAQAARALNLSRTTFWRRLAAEPDIRRLADLSASELVQEKDAAGGDTAVVAAKLGLPVDLLARRFRSIG